MFRIFYFLAVFGLIFVTVRIPVLDISVSDVFIFLALCAWGYQYIHQNGRGGWGIPNHPLWIPAFMVLVGGLLATPFAYEPSTSFAISIKIWFVLSVWIAMTILMVRRGDLRAVLYVFLAGVFFTALIAVIDRILGTDIGGAISGRGTPFWGRSDGTVGHPVELGLICSVALPLAVGLFLDEWKKQKRRKVLLVFGLASVIILTAVFLSGTVASWISTAISMSIMGLLLALTLKPKVLMGLALGLAAVVSIVGLYVLLAPNLETTRTYLVFDFNRATSITGPGRFALLGQALDYVGQHPFIGAGMDQTGTGGIGWPGLVTTDLVHNPILSGWVGGGLLVFIALVACYAIVFVSGIQALFHGVRRSDWVAIGLGACVIGWAVFDQSQPHLYHRYTWMTIALVFGLGFTVRFSNRAARVALAGMPPLPHVSALAQQTGWQSSETH